MAERPRARLNRILDALVRQVRNHARDYPHLWLKTPADVRRDVGVAFDLYEVPSVFFTPGESVTPQEGGVSGSGYLHEDRADVLAVLRARGADGGERIIELRADFLRAITANEQLAGLDGSGALCDFVTIGETSWGTSEDQGYGVVSRAEIPLQVLYSWLHEEP